MEVKIIMEVKVKETMAEETIIITIDNLAEGTISKWLLSVSVNGQIIQYING
jgi:hypothetical protein